MQIVVGVTLGFAAAYALAAALATGVQNTLFGVTARDPITYTAVFAIVTTVSLLATLVPARRATRLDPMIALRAE